LYILKFSFVGQYAVCPFTDAMRTIAKVIGEFIEKHFKHDKIVEKIPPNNCVLITYLSGMSLPEHRDITYSKK
jgi:DNA gyrase inhibitor GyrI